MNSGKQKEQDPVKSPWELFVAKLATVFELVTKKKRVIEEVNRVLDLIIDFPHFITVLDAARGASMDTEEPREGWARMWERFYFEVFGLKVDLSDVAVSPYQPGFGWVVYVLKDLTQNQIYAKCRDRFSCSSVYGDDIDHAITEEDRDPGKIGTYARRFRNRIEADEELKGKSANVLREEKAEANTFREAAVLELFYEWRTGGQHLNLRTLNLCAGSRDDGGGVPGVDWRGGWFRVRYGRPSSSSDYLRARAAG